MKKFKIALMIDWYLPGTKAGGPVRSVYSLLNVMKEHFDFFLITTNHDLGSSLPYPDIVPDTFTEKDGITYYYFSKENLSPSNLQTLFTSISPDLIYLNSLWSYHFSIAIVRMKNSGAITTPVLLAPRGMLGKGALGLKSAKKTLFLTAAKWLDWYKTIAFHASQNQEQEDIRAQFKTNTIYIAPNINSGSVQKNKSSKEKNKIKLFYLSRLARVKNLHFALSALRYVKKDISVEYDLFGNIEDKEYWNECLSIIRVLPANVSVTYKSELKFDEVQGVLSHYHALYLPTLNENFGHAIVESLLCGCPVIISDQTPWNDVESYGVGFALNLSDIELFARAINTLAQLNQEQFTAMSLKANKYICEKINIQEITQQYKNLFNDCIKNRSL